MEKTCEIKFASAVSFKQKPESAAAELGEQLDAQLDGGRPDVVLLFPSHHYAPSAGA